MANPLLLHSDNTLGLRPRAFRYTDVLNQLMLRVSPKKGAPVGQSLATSCGARLAYEGQQTSLSFHGEPVVALTVKTIGSLHGPLIRFQACTAQAAYPFAMADGIVIEQLLVPPEGQASVLDTQPKYFQPVVSNTAR